MAQGQKLESVGRVAAGVAHEINTSVQFISDSVRFVRHALRDVPHALADYRALAAGALSGKDVTAAARKAATPTKPRTSTTSSRTPPTRWIARSTASAAWVRSSSR